MITTFGEIMLRISPSYSNERIEQANSFRIEQGGSESNVAIALSNLGAESQFVTRLPDNELNKIILQQLKRYSINTNNICLGGNRLGIYWTEIGSGPRNSYVIYDRENSAFSESNTADFDWGEILKNSKWFHFSGISPAVSRSVTGILEKAINECLCPYSVDLNYRSKLWNWIAKDAQEIKKIMTNLCIKSTLIIGNESDYNDIFSIDSVEIDDTKKYSEIAKKMFDKFPNTNYIAISNRKSISATINHWNGYLFVRNDNHFCYKGMDYNLDNVQDRVGTGDSFAAGIIYGLNSKKIISFQQIIDFAVSLSALNHTTVGDASCFSVSDVTKVIATQGSGRIVR
ncbi:sugar kinase [Flavobacteriaceae bacterium]|nr:sugar kinase [Flavobacteriaceae bacterium]